jgi:hypothetical protein
VTPFFSSWAGWEELAGLHATEVEKARKDLDELRITHEHHRDAASVAVMVVRSEAILLHNQLRALPGRVCAAVTTGVHQGRHIAFPP